jgi:hypothetical protein
VWRDHVALTDHALRTVLRFAWERVLAVKLPKQLVQRRFASLSLAWLVEEVFGVHGEELGLIRGAP